MANHYKLDRALIVNEADGTRTVIEAGKYVLTEADGRLTSCTEAELQDNIARVDAEIQERDTRIEAERLEAERLAQEEALQEQAEEPSMDPPIES